MTTDFGILFAMGTVLGESSLVSDPQSFAPVHPSRNGPGVLALWPRSASVVGQKFDEQQKAHFTQRREGRKGHTGRHTACNCSIFLQLGTLRLKFHKGQTPEVHVSA